ncbi:metabotropic glutamate receptor 2-like [Amphiura filiformis]|uniref:metabotropic glutamate receptor 2-like n=1 Tax=Amphiura filiformis TaxID=82378 RepID=UPI003B228840
MVFAIQEINDNTTLLPNITLGFDIHDTCSYDSRTLQECLDFLPISDDTCRPSALSCSNNADWKAPVVGVVGAQRSASSVLATTLLGQYHIPLVSYLSTSDELSNNLRYPYFLRAVGPDSYQVKTIVDILLRFQWTYVAFINSDDTYGRSARTEFDTLADINGICVGYSKIISQSYSAKMYDNLIQELVDFQGGSHASVVILFAHQENARMMFSATTRMRATRRFIWIGSDGWGNYGKDAVNEGDEEAALGAFTIAPESESLADFNIYFQSLNPDSSNNPWLPKFNTTKLNEQSSHETLVMDSVFAFAHALENMRVDLCPTESTGLCAEMQPINGEVLLTHLLNTSFTSLVNGDISFMPNGDVLGRYSIRYLNFTDNAYNFVKVGKWQNDVTLEENITWYTRNEMGSDAPISVCSKPCQTGEIKISFDHACCWTCSECEKHEYVLDKRHCQSCIDHDSKTFGWPDENRTSCVKIPAGYNGWKAPVVCLASLGLIFTCIIVGLYAYKRENKLIKASSREISYIMFIGIFLAYISALLLVIHPTTGVCYLLRILSPIATSFIYVSLAVKTTRLFRIFRASMKSAKRPRFIRPKTQIALIVGLTAIPFIWTIIWIVLNVPEVSGAMPQGNQYYLEITCSHSDQWTYGLIVWNMSWVLVCTILAALTRQLPENYNESKFITFCAFCSLVVFLAFSSTFLAISHDNAYSIAGYSALGLIVNTTVVLFSLFVVKLYAVYFVQIEKWNVQRRASASVSSISKRHSNGISNGGFASESPDGDAPEVSGNGRVSSRSRDYSIRMNHPGNNNSDFAAENLSEPRDNSDSRAGTSSRTSNDFDSNLAIGESRMGESNLTDDHNRKHKSLELINEPSLSNDMEERRPASLVMLNDLDIKKRKEFPYNRSDSALSINSIHELPSEIEISAAENV